MFSEQLNRLVIAEIHRIEELPPGPEKVRQYLQATTAFAAAFQMLVTNPTLLTRPD
jgi:hypothetical protein